MPKKQLRFGENPLKYICNEGYYAVRNRLPDWVNDRMLAFSLGFISGYGAACFGKHVIHPHIVEPITGISLENTTKYSLIATTSIPVGAKVIAPGTVKTWRKLNPLYSSGVLGVMAGAATKSLVELL